MLTDENRLFAQGFRKINKNTYVKNSISVFENKRCSVKHMIVLDKGGHVIKNIVEKTQ